MAQTAEADRARPAPRGLLLDAMGTLIGLRRSVGATYAELAAAHGVNLTADAIDAAFPRLFRQAPPLAFPGLKGRSCCRPNRAGGAI